MICSGGGGIPVLLEDNALRGVEAVVDKEASSALLAARLGADRLLLLTDCDGAYRNWGAPNAQLIRRASPKGIRQLSFTPGSMAPKVAAACDFVDATGRDAVIGSLDDAAAILRGIAGRRSRGTRTTSSSPTHVPKP